jgi:hypothetical protein
LPHFGSPAACAQAGGFASSGRPEFALSVGYLKKVYANVAISQELIYTKIGYGNNP